MAALRILKTTLNSHKSIRSAYFSSARDRTKSKPMLCFLGVSKLHVWHWTHVCMSPAKTAGTNKCSTSLSYDLRRYQKKTTLGFAIFCVSICHGLVLYHWWSGRRTFLPWGFPLCWGSQGHSWTILNSAYTSEHCFSSSSTKKHYFMRMKWTNFRTPTSLGQSCPSQPRRGWATRSSRSTSWATRASPGKLTARLDKAWILAFFFFSRRKMDGSQQVLNLTSQQQRWCNGAWGIKIFQLFVLSRDSNQICIDVPASLTVDQKYITFYFHVFFLWLATLLWSVVGK